MIWPLEHVHRDKAKTVSMKKKADEEGGEGEVVKAVAQAWLGHSDCSSRPTTEFDARRLNFKTRPTRFKLEAMAKDHHGPAAAWDFGQSLLDSYEIVCVSKRLEAGLVLGHQFSGLDDTLLGIGKKRKERKESKNSLRTLFNRASSRRFNEANPPRKKGTQF